MSLNLLHLLSILHRSHLQRLKVKAGLPHLTFNFTIMLCTLYTETDYTSGTTITVDPPGPRACIDFTDLVVDDDLASEGVEAFTISIRENGEMAMVVILDDDGKFTILSVLQVLC